MEANTKRLIVTMALALLCATSARADTLYVPVVLRELPPPTLVVFDGNSLSVAPVGAEYPDMVAQLLDTASYSAETVSIAVSGQTTADMLRDAMEEADGLYDPARPGVIVVWEGTNDLYFGASPNDAYEHLATYCRDRKDHGWRVVLLTLLPRSKTGTRGMPPTFETDRQNINARLRVAWPGVADVLVDVGADPIIGLAGQETDPLYYSDRLHLTAAGNQIVAEYVASAIVGLDAIPR
jgi:lysophospholipase L1-like esterase